MERTFAPIPAETEHIATEIIGAAIEVHRELGPGFLEKIYQEALCLELHARGLRFERERAVVVRYHGVAIPGQRIDLIVAGCVLVELKAAARVDHDQTGAQARRRFSARRSGFLALDDKLFVSLWRASSWPSSSWPSSVSSPSIRFS